MIPAGETQDYKFRKEQFFSTSGTLVFSLFTNFFRFLNCHFFFHFFLLFYLIFNHTVKGGEILKEKGYSDALVRAIRSHNDATGVRRESRMEHALYACDEISGFVTACALVRPSRSLSDLEPSSVKKKLKQIGFARSVDREAVLKGPEPLGIPFDDHCAFVIAAMRGIAADLGL